MRGQRFSVFVVRRLGYDDHAHHAMDLGRVAGLQLLENFTGTKGEVLPCCSASAHPRLVCHQWVLLWEVGHVALRVNSTQSITSCRWLRNTSHFNAVMAIKVQVVRSPDDRHARKR